MRDCYSSTKEKDTKRRRNLTFNLILIWGITANICIASITVTNACQDVGNLDARQTEAKMLAFSDEDLDALRMKMRKT